MDESYELQTHKVEDEHWWYRGRRQIIREAVRGLGLAPEARILDVGCGSGRNMVELAAFGQVTGFELSGPSVEIARNRDVGEVVEGSLDARLPFDDAEFDLAVALDVIEHLDDDVLALRELRRVVRPGEGRMLITVPAYQWLWSAHDEVNHHRRRYTRPTLLSAAAQAGWNPVWTTYFNSLLLPAAVAFRAVQRARQTEDPSANSDLEKTPGWLNDVLERPLRFEARLISRKRKIPAGLSLLAVFA